MGPGFLAAREAVSDRCRATGGLGRAGRRYAPVAPGVRFVGALRCGAYAGGRRLLHHPRRRSAGAFRTCSGPDGPNHRIRERCSGRSPVLATFAPGTALKLPRASNWSLSVDREFSSHITARVAYLRRRGSDGLNFVNTLAPDAPPSLLPLSNGSAPGVYQLSSLRRDNFDSVQFTVRQTLAAQYEWMASYTRSRAQSNAILDPNAPAPLQVLPSLIPMPWDTPNRFLGWAYVPLPLKNWAVAVLADGRSGFPFSVQQQTGIVTGPVNSYRYPFNFDLNLAIERMLTLRGYRFALRGGVNNLTNQNNPTAVNNVTGAPQFLQFFGYEGRHFVVRIRFFGRAGTK